MDGWWLDVWGVIRQEFSDLPSVAEFTRTCVRLSMALLLGGILGYERESAGASAGFRTHMLVALGSALFVLVPLQAGTPLEDMTRVLQGVIAGIGFLGAGAIIKLGMGLEIRGLTTAASIWLTSAVGIAAGMGREATAIVSTLFGLAILSLARLLKKPDHSGSDKVSE
ncbi:MgtC/SapB family protein [Noviherbaspirillum sedimenti]|uniref:Protein MgtC n=1 Tax=Noviherbaspirillum sedimenti TaxID=2320865 RepID=A0A3A3G0K8_9BURK|nr:MgtC/SapB family protein [Noviherbaspirillum sedimenti]RJG01977.1 MgtC/SapB family protein [Noviherbaspirillum sedimenti]